jgi:hypothetical protein
MLKVEQEALGKLAGAQPLDEGLPILPFGFPPPLLASLLPHTLLHFYFFWLGP